MNIISNIIRRLIESEKSRMFVASPDKNTVGVVLFCAWKFKSLNFTPDVLKRLRRTIRSRYRDRKVIYHISPPGFSHRSSSDEVFANGLLRHRNKLPGKSGQKSGVCVMDVGA